MYMRSIVYAAYHPIQHSGVQCEHGKSFAANSEAAGECSPLCSFIWEAFLHKTSF